MVRLSALLLALALVVSACDAASSDPSVPDAFDLPDGAQAALFAHWDAVAGDRSVEHRITRAWKGDPPTASESVSSPTEIWCVEAEISMTGDPNVDGSHMMWIVARSDDERDWSAALLASMSSTWPYEACAEEA